MLRSPGVVHVVNVCTGLPPSGSLGRFDSVFGVTDSRDLMRTRLDEDLAALALAGRSRVNLGYLDEQYRDGELPADELVAAIGAVVDGVSWLCAPAGIGAHPDHVAVRDAAVALGRDRGVQVVFYADLPYAVWAGWPHWVTGEPPRPYLVPDARWTPDLASIAIAPSHELVPAVQVLGDDEAARKLAAIECYETQFAALNAGPLDRLRVPEVIGFELLWFSRP